MFSVAPPQHKWNYSPSWNGNNPEKFPMLSGIERGIARSGYRCLHCGAFAWDEPDREWGMKIGIALGLIKIRVRVPARCEVVK